MEPTCSHFNNDDKKIPSAEKSTESKTETKASEKEGESDETERNVDDQQVDEIEGWDFKEENRLINRSSEMVADTGKLPTSSHLLNNVSIANFQVKSTAPDFQKVSALSNIQVERNQPGCSTGDFLTCDGNPTNKSILKVRKVLFPSETETNEKSKTIPKNKLLSKPRNEKCIGSSSTYKEASMADSFGAKERDGLLEEKNKVARLYSQICSIHKSPISSQTKRTKSSTNFVLALNSNTMSGLSNIQKKRFSLPSCSSENLPSNDSNTTIRNMIKGRRVLFPEETEPVKKYQEVRNHKSHSEVELKKISTGGSKDFDETMTEVEVGASAISDDVGAIETSELLYLKSMLAAGSSDRKSSLSTTSSHSDCIKDLMAPSSSSIKQLSEDSTSESQFDESSSQNPISKSFLQELCSGDSNEDDESLWCICPSSHEAEEDSLTSELTNQSDSSDDSRVWRKRMCDPPCAAGSSAAKKFCPDVSIPSMTHESSWLVNLSVPNSSAPVHQSPPELKQWLNRFNSWSNCERLQAIDALITRSATGQVRHMMDAIEPLFTRDFISQLPKELALTVLSYLGPLDLVRAARTCRDWNFLANDKLLWKEQCRRIGVPCGCSKCESRWRRYKIYDENTWKTVYRMQYLTEKNWMTGGDTDDPIVVKGHDDHVITCLQFYKGRIVSGSDDTTLKVWCAISGRCLRTLVGHTGGVWSSQMSSHLVISGSTDRTLRIWCLRTGLCLNVLYGHTSTVRCLALHHNRVVSGSRDTTLRVWSVDGGHCERVLTGHLGAVRCVQFNGKLVVSGAYDFFVKVWNVDNGDCIHTLAGHTNRVYSLQFDGVHVVSGSLDTSIRVWDVVSGACKHVLTGHQSLTSGMELRSNLLVSGNADSTVKVWDITTGQCLHTLSGPFKHHSAVTCLQSTKRFVITSSDDGTVKLWDLRTGEFIRNLLELESGGSGGVVWRIRASTSKLVCAVGSRNGTEETKLIVLDFGIARMCSKCNCRH